MTEKRELLREQYEEALFALMMDEIAAAEGERLLAENEGLINDPSAAVPAEVDEAVEDIIRRHFAREKTRSAGRRVLKGLKYAALAACLGGLLFVMAFGLSETVRVNTMNLMIEMFGDHVSLRFVPEDDTPNITVGWVPEGFELVKEEHNLSGGWYGYRKSEEELINVRYVTASGTGWDISTEDGEISYVDINGREAMLVEREDGDVTIIWLSEDGRYLFDVYGRGVSTEDLLHVAREVHYETPWPAGAVNSNPLVTVGWVPEGYELEKQEDSKVESWRFYQKSETEWLDVDYIRSDGTVMEISTEGAEVDYIEVNGSRAMYVKSDSLSQLIWSDGKDGIISIVASGMSEQDFLHVAREVKYNSPWPDQTDSGLSVTVGWVPQGYVRGKYRCDEYDGYIQYKRSETDYFFVKYYVMTDHTSMGLDISTEGMETSYIEINGCQAMLAESEERQYITWHPQEDLILSVVGEGTNKGDMLRVAQGLRYKEMPPTKAKDSGLPVTVGWVPQGYVLENQGHDLLGGQYEYRKSEEDGIYINYYMISQGLTGDISTENAEVSYVEINGILAMLVDGGDYKVVTWPSKDNKFLFEVIGTGSIDKKDLLHVARELKYEGMKPTKAEEDGAPQIKAGWVPDGYGLVDLGHDQTSSWCEYRRSEAESLYIEYLDMYRGQINVDTENADVKYVDVKGSQAMSVQKDAKQIFVWPIKDHNAVILMDGDGMTREEMIRVANELWYEGMEAAEDSGAPWLWASWLPEGFVMTNRDGDNISVWYDYRKPGSETAWINIDCTKTSGMGGETDTEDADIEYMELRGCQAMVIEYWDEDRGIQILWPDKDNTVLVCLFGVDVSREDLIRVAEGLIY